MKLAVWDNGDIYSSRKIFFIDVTESLAFEEEAFALYRLVRPEAKRLGVVETYHRGRTTTAAFFWEGPTTTLWNVLADEDWWFYGGGNCNMDETQEKACLARYEKFLGLKPTEGHT